MKCGSWFYCTRVLFSVILTQFLRNQFHDVLPGSSIGMVYKDAEQYYEVVTTTANNLIASALASVTQGAAADGVIAVNTTNFNRREVVELPEGVKSQQKSHTGKPLGKLQHDSLFVVTTCRNRKRTRIWIPAHRSQRA